MLSTLFASVTTVWSQDPLDGDVPIVPILPQTIITRSVTAQGDVIRASGEAYRDYQMGNVFYAEARKRLAEAVDLELDNYLKYAETYFDRRITRERKLIELRDVYERKLDQSLERRQNRVDRVLVTLLEDHERSRTSITSGQALNKLLFALADTPVLFGVDLGPSLKSRVEEGLSIDSQQLAKLMMKTPGPSGRKFPLMSADGIDLSWWPDHLMEAGYTPLREQLAGDATMLLKNSKDGRVDRDTLQGVKRSLAALSQAYYRDYPIPRRNALDQDERQQFRLADAFLVRMADQIETMRNTGRLGALEGSEKFDPATHGKNIKTLAAWMLQNGVTFDRVKTGDESTYHQMFAKLAELYALVAG